MSHDPMFDVEIPETCVECDMPLWETNDTGFCCDGHEAAYVARQRAADNAHAESLREDARLAAEWRATRDD